MPWWRRMSGGRGEPYARSIDQLEQRERHDNRARSHARAGGLEPGHAGADVSRRRQVLGGVAASADGLVCDMAVRLHGASVGASLAGAALLVVVIVSLLMAAGSVL